MRRVGDGGLCVCVCKTEQEDSSQNNRKIVCTNVGMHQERTKVCTNNATWCYSVFSLSPSVELIVQKKEKKKKETQRAD